VLNLNFIEMKHHHYLQLELIPDEFKEGIRVLFATGRKKDGGVHQSDKKCIRKISRSKEEFDEQAKILIDAVDSDDQLSRVYASVNCRNINKAIRQFKFNQLEADFYQEEDKHGFYNDVKNRWISCLAIPASRADNKFLIDCDSDEEKIKALAFCNEGGSGVKIYWSYITKNGFHIICSPFNPEKLDVEIKKDGMFLVHFKRNK